MPTRKVWNQHGYFITNVNDDLTIPTQQQSHVAGPLNDIFNGFLMQLSPKDINGDPIQPVPDVQAVQIETDNSNCPESILVMVQIDNIGESSFPIGMPISIYKENPFTDSQATLLETQFISEIIVNGTSKNFTFQIDSIVGLPADIYVVLNDNGSLSIPFSLDDFPNTNTIECDYSNNIIHLLMSCTEICGNGIDDDNDGLTDCEDPDCAVPGSEINISLCPSDTYDFNGIMISEAGIYYDTIPSSLAMCDSVITLTVTKNERFFENLSESICENEFYNFGNQMLNQSGIYTDSSKTIFGCDSITILNLKVTPIPLTQISEQICEGDFYAFGGNNYNFAGQYFDTIQIENHCDSIVQLDLIVNPVFSIKIDKTICEGSNYIFGNQTITQSGTYTEIFKTKENCDSTVTLNLTVSNQSITNISESICSHDTFFFDNQILNSSGQYEQHLKTIQGCDSIILLNLDVIQPITVHINQSLCQGDEYPFNNQNLTESGNYSATFESAAGCDSIVLLNLEVRQNIEINKEKNLCDGDSIEVNNTFYDTAGSYDIQMQASSGCDSIIHLIIHTGNSSIHEITEEICAGASIDFYNQTLFTSGDYQKDYLTATGCDSSILLHLIVHENVFTTIDTFLCFGGVFPLGNSNYHESGVYEKRFRSQYGCDSIVSLHLEIENQLEHHINTSICEDEAFEIDGHVYSKAGDYEYLLSSQKGCDSTIYIHLVQNENYENTIQKEICEGEFIEIDQKKYTETGQYTIPYTSISGCDSILHLNLTVFPTYFASMTESICPNDTFTFLNKAYFKEGIYEIELQTEQGCDSIIELQLQVYPTSNVAITGVKPFCLGESITLKATKNFKTYLWNNGNSEANIITNQSGNYSVTVSDDNDCTTSSSVFVDPPIELMPHYSTQSPYCLGLDDGFIKIDSISGGMPPYIISFDGQNYENQQEFTDLPPGDYPIIISDGNKCISELNITLSVPYLLDLDLETDVNLKLGDSIQLFATPNFDAKYVIWTPTTGLSCGDCQNPYVKIDQDIIYTVTAYDQFGCLAEGELSLRVINEHNVYIPSGFTPNGDGINDIFTVFTDVNIKEVEILEIFDRWGNKVFTQQHFPTNEIEYGWDGTFDHEAMNPAVYTYYTYVVFLDGKRWLYEGDVTLLR